MADLEFRMLGPLEVLRQGAAVPLGPGRARALLGILLLHANRVVPADRLVEDLWRGDPPASAAHALQVYASSLRRLLEPDRGRGTTAKVLVGRRPGYVLVVPPEGCDAQRFEALVAEGGRALGDGRAADASRILGRALALWRGPVLADLADEPFVRPEAARLEELRLVAAEEWVEAELSLGRHAELVSQLEALVRQYPFREHLWAQMIVALYRSGRQAEALRAYQRLRDLLGEELGLDPSPELRQLEAAVLRHDPALAIPVAIESGQPRPPVSVAPSPAPVNAGTTAAPPGDDVPIEELRVLTALFADLVGSTPLGERLDPEEFALVVNGAVDHMAACAEALGGTIANRPGDGILALFGAPRAHEDDPERAVRAGLRIVEEVSAYGDEVARSWEVEPLRARVGIDTGPVVVGAPGDPAVLGDALNTAARLQSAGQPGSVLVSAATVALIGPLFDWSEPRHLALKGKAVTVEAVEALGARPVPGKVRGLEGRRLPLIGRDPEMAVAGGSVDSVLAGTGGVLIVTSEAGIGKSRLLAELRGRFEQSVSPGGRPLWLEGRCLSWGESLAYWPFRELLREWLGASPTHPELRTRVTLRRKVEELFEAESADIATFLAGVLGLPLEREAAERLAPLPPESLQRTTFDAFRSLLERLADEGPVVLAVDDVHWADATSLQLVEHLLPATETAAILLVLALRPERDHGSWRIREMALRELGHRTREVTLEALAGGAEARMLDELVGPGTLPSPVAEELLGAAEGNPLFIEELVRSLLDAGALRHGPEGWRFEGHLAVEIPRSIENVLASRIDRLPGAVRAVLGAAAVLGRQLELGVLADVCQEETDLEHALGELQRLDLLQQVRRWPKAEYRFRHPLIQDAAYRRLVGDRRRELHRRAAHALETLFPDRLAESYGVLALHYERAGEAERALAYHRLAADAARRTHALTEAARHYTAALDLVASTPTERSRHERPPLHLGRGYAWWQLADHRAGDELREALTSARAVADTASELAALEILWVVEGLVEGHHDRALARLEEALAVARRVGDLAAEVSVRNRLTVALVNRLELDRALENGQEALAIAGHSADEALTARAMDGLKLVAFALADYPTLRQLARDLEDLLRRHGDRWYLQFVLAESSFAVAASGDWEDAIRRLDEAQALNEELGGRSDTPYFLTLRAWLERARGRYGEAVRLGGAATAASRERRNTQWLAWSEADLGAILAELGAVGEAIEHLERGRLAAERGGIRIQLVRLQAHLALARFLAGDPAAARELEIAEELMEQVSTPPGKVFLYGLDAYLAVARVRLARGEVEAAVDGVAPLLPAAESAGWAEGVARTALVLGECSALGGEVAAAAGLFEQALEAAASGRLPPVEWQAHGALARLWRDRGDAAGAEVHLRLARAIVDGLGASITDPRLCEAFTKVAREKLEEESGGWG